MAVIAKNSSCDAFSLKPFMKMPEFDTQTFQYCIKTFGSVILPKCQTCIVTISKWDILINNLSLQYILWPEKL